MLFPWQISARRAASMRSRIAGGSAKPFQARITAVNPATEHVQVAHYGGAEQLKILHPAMAGSAWIRFIPDDRTTAILHYLDDTKVHDITSYFAASPSSRLAEFSQGQTAYFPMGIGEIDITSRGLAHAYFSNRGLLRLRGGINIMNLSQPDLEIWSKSPTHRRAGTLHIAEELSDEERFGVVKRPQTTGGAKRYKYVKIEAEFAKEYLRTIKVKREPGILIDHREGDVIDQEGEPIKATETDIPLRAKKLWYTRTGQSVRFELDEEGNVKWQLPTTATTGMITRIDGGSMATEVKNDIKFNSLAGDININAAAGSITEAADSEIHMSAVVRITLKATAIEIDAGELYLNGRRVMYTGGTI